LVSAHVQRASVVACVPGRPCLRPSPTTPQRHALGIMPPQDTFALLDFSGHDGRFPAPSAPCPSHLNVVLGRALHIVVFEVPSWTTMHIKRSGTSFCLPFSLGEQVTPSSLGMDLLLRKVLARGGRGVRGLRQPNQDHDRVSAQETVCPHNAPCPTQSIQTPETAINTYPALTSTAAALETAPASWRHHLWASSHPAAIQSTNHRTSRHCHTRVNTTPLPHLWQRRRRLTSRPGGQHGLPRSPGDSDRDQPQQ
jgi:hypothetical protein